MLKSLPTGRTWSLPQFNRCNKQIRKLNPYMWISFDFNISHNLNCTRPAKQPWWNLFMELLLPCVLKRSWCADRAGTWPNVISVFFFCFTDLRSSFSRCCTTQHFQFPSQRYSPILWWHVIINHFFCSVLMFLFDCYF